MKSLSAAIERLDPLTVSGRVAAVNGLLIEARGGLTRLAVGARAEIGRFGEKPLAAEVVGFRDTRALLMPFGPVEGVAPGAAVVTAGAGMALAGLAFSYLAIAQNRYAAPTIHQQAGQRLIDTGLYAVVRHPFYAGMLLVYAGTALWLGSYAAAVASTAFLVMTLARIVIEEAHLRRALPGYGAYARRVRGRLIPFLL